MLLRFRGTALVGVANGSGAAVGTGVDCGVADMAVGEGGSGAVVEVGWVAAGVEVGTAVGGVVLVVAA